MTVFAMIEEVHLSSGAHESREDGMCAMEAVAWLAGESHSDEPSCVCPVLASFVRSWNDLLNDADRNRLLKPLLHTLVGTRSDQSVEERRRWLILDWLARVHVPTWLDLMEPLRKHADALRALPEICSKRDEDCAKAELVIAKEAARCLIPTLDDPTADDPAAWEAVCYSAGFITWYVAANAATYAAAAALGAGVDLKPTVKILQRKATELIADVIACGPA